MILLKKKIKNKIREWDWDTCIQLQCNYRHLLGTWSRTKCWAEGPSRVSVLHVIDGPGLGLTIYSSLVCVSWFQSPYLIALPNRCPEQRKSCILRPKLINCFALFWQWKRVAAFRIQWDSHRRRGALNGEREETWIFPGLTLWSPLAEAEGLGAPPHLLYISLLSLQPSSHNFTCAGFGCSKPLPHFVFYNI